MVSPSAESITASLFREYLHRHNLRNTLEAFDNEVPRDPNSISNRLELARSLGITKLVKQNKQKEHSYLSMAEIIVNHLSGKSQKGSEPSEKTEETVNHSAIVKGDGLVIKGTFSLQSNKTSCSIHRSNPSSKAPSSPQKSPSHGPQSSQGPQPGILGNPVKAGLKNGLRHTPKLWSDHSLDSSPSKPHSNEPLSIIGSAQKSPSKISRPPSRQRNSITEFESLEEVGEYTPPPSINHFPEKKASNIPGSTLKSQENMEFLDIEDEIDVELDRINLSNVMVKEPKKSMAVVDITSAQAMDLRNIVFGNATGTSFNPEWEKQSFVFNDTQHLEFGLVQHKGGPCGILAVVQAGVIKHIISSTNPNLSPRNAERQQILIKVLACILWQTANYTGGTKTVYVCSNSGRSKFQSSLMYRNDGVTEKLQITQCNTLASTEVCVREFLPQFQNNMGKGCILLLYSAVLSRGIDQIKEDMDEVGCTLMANHGYCSQELVNLLLVGYAAQNVFNDVIDCGGKMLKGVKERQDIGLLTLYEHYKVFEVGCNLKHPVCGVWVICSESHYSVLFTTQRDISPEQPAELIYYDSLGRQPAPYNLSIYPNSAVDSKNDDPPLELCIRTRWPNARVDWNGSEPLL